MIYVPAWLVTYAAPVATLLDSDLVNVAVRETRKGTGQCWHDPTSMFLYNLHLDSSGVYDLTRTSFIRLKYFSLVHPAFWPRPSLRSSHQGTTIPMLRLLPQTTGLRHPPRQQQQQQRQIGYTVPLHSSSRHHSGKIAVKYLVKAPDLNHSKYSNTHNSTSRVVRVECFRFQCRKFHQL